MDKEEDFISLYLEYTNQTECPTFYHRWSAINCLAAYLGRQCHYRFGHFNLYPNHYTMLIGSPGTKKSTAIKIGAKLLSAAGYTTFAAKKTRQEKFLLDLAEQGSDSTLDGDLGGDILDQNLWGDESVSSCAHKPPAECFIAADEFNNFIGLGNMDFISILGDLWDYEGVFDYKLKNSKSVYIPNPTINLLGGNTPTGFAQAFPVDSLGQGFFSRLLLIYAEPTGIKFFPIPEPDKKLESRLISILHRVKEVVTGELKTTPEATEILKVIYNTWEPLEDIRFESYANRRLTHLIKLCLIMTAARSGREITKEDVVKANTLLSFTEQLMPKALGEFGKSKNSAISHKVMAALDNAIKPKTFRELWKVVHQDLDTRQQLVDIINNLQVASKIQPVKYSGGGHEETGYLPIKNVIKEELNGTLDWTLLTDTERNLI